MQDYMYSTVFSSMCFQVPRRASTGSIAPSLSSPNKTKRDSGSTPEALEAEEEGAASSSGGEQHTAPVTPPPRQSSLRKIVLVDPKDESDDSLLRQLATERFQALLHLESDEILRDAVEVRDVEAGSCLMKQDALQEAALVYILTGSLTVSQHEPERSEDIQLFTAHPGDLVGGLAVLSGDPSFFTVRARHHAKVATVTRETFFK